MKKLLYKILILFIPVFVLILAINSTTNYFINNNKYYKINDSIINVFFGNSHSECAINDSIVNKSLNLSQSGDSYFYIYYKLKKIIEANPHIKNIFLEYTNTVFLEAMNDWTYKEEYMGNKYPKYSQLISTKDNLFLLSKNPIAFLKSFKEACYFKISYLHNNQKEFYRHLSWGGYLFLIKNNLPKTTEILTTKAELNAPISTLNISYLEKIIILAKIKNINLVLIRSPLHHNYNRVFETKLYKFIRSKYNYLQFLDFSDFPLENIEYADVEHLNYKGAKKFSDELNKLMKANKWN